MTQLILLRHGQSIWNQDRRFTGWSDVALSPQGEQEAE
ncbi:MAG: histidine phosphatase family protein, partial [Nitrosomonadaceae bacterium]